MTQIESFDQWLNKQLWPDDVKGEARELNESLALRNLNPLTLKQWIIWAKDKGLVVTR